MRRRLTASLVMCAVAALALAPAISAVKPPSTRLDWLRDGLLPEPGRPAQDQSLTDQKDADYAALQPAYHEVTLTNLDGSGYLVGDWANIRARDRHARRIRRPTPFLYHRNDDRFEQVMAYYWVTEAQKYIQSLGFGSTRRAGQQGIAGHPDQPVRHRQLVLVGQARLLRFGKGGVDDAEDAEVILHEYGHAIQDSQVAGFGVGPEAGGIGEGFGDYWAVTVSNVIAPTPDAPCVADWDSVSYTSTVPHCLRRVDTNAALPGGPRGRGPRQRPDLVARPVGHPQRARARPGRHADPRGAVRLRARHDDAGRGRRDGRGRAVPLRHGVAATVHAAFVARGIL